MKVTYQTSKNVNPEQLEKLYDDAGWYAYKRDLKVLHQAVSNSLDVITAWEGDELIGLIRVVGDGLTINYIQDILVLRSHQNQGIATGLLQRILEKYSTVRQKVLLTEEAADVSHFYEKNGFTSCDNGSLVAFAKLN